MKQSTLARIEQSKVITVIRTTSLDNVEAVIQALLDGGIRAFCVSTTISQPYKVIETLVKKHGKDVLVGASAVFDGEVAQKAINAGAEFIVSPFTDQDVISVCDNNGTFVVQGASTPTEIMEAVRLGSGMVNVFPAEHLGGAPYLKALKASLPSAVKLAASGDIGAGNISQYMKVGLSAVFVSNAVVQKNFVRGSDWDAIRDRAEKLLHVMEPRRTVKSS